ncbi:hypothetical protein B0H13DRAFT_2674685 [Mycena leptocephala]|nr:hypothetical protein B0H13DRAFT_2674685 [Mycena leptocephala]
MAMANSGRDPMRTPLQARRIRTIAITLPILLVTGYAIIDRIVNKKDAARPLPARNPDERFNTGGPRENS